MGARGLFNKRAGTHTKMIRLTLLDTHFTYRLIKDGLQIDRMTFECAPKRSVKIVRCYKCQVFGHIAIACLASVSSCVNCNSHVHDVDNSLVRVNSFCKNCRRAHPADNSCCPIFRQITSRLLTRQLA